MEKKAELKLTKLYNAYAADGFQIKKAYALSGGLGVMAVHKSAKDYDARRGKRSYYLEGTPYERGYLLGLLAEPQIAEMAVRFTDSIIFDFIDMEFLNRFPLLQKLVVALLYELSENAWNTLPRHIHEEAAGMLAGCKKSNARTRVTLKRLIVMNVGFDALCALVYTGGFLHKHAPELEPGAIKLTMMCNAFSVFGRAAGGGHYFARDFMFATGGVFQNNLAHILHNPVSEQGERLYPYVSVTSPGIVGSISAVNINGVAVGVNMSPGANCDPQNVGLNSLLLARECILRGGSAQEAAVVIQNASRGVSWNYILSDGGNDAACTVEAGASWERLDFLQYPQPALRPYLPDAAYIAAHMPAPVVNGAMVRRCGDPFPEEYFSFNEGLWQHYRRTNNARVQLHEDAFLPDGFINRAPEEKNCPESFYFAPERTAEGVFITTNHFVLPPMRLCAMDSWTARVTHGNVNDIQWRYDELNHQLREALFAQGHIDYKTAKRIAEYLAPYGEHPGYYAKNPKSRDGKQLRIEGCVSVFDLKAKTVESHYGYYGDEWVKTTLQAYF